jgi:1,4-alpha-glucan branching enzyme
MPRLIFILFVLLPLFSCSGDILLNRVKGIKGPQAPQVLDGQVLFTVAAPEASFVTIAGNFNGWNPQAAPLLKDSNGTWSVKLDLPKGRKYYYKFVIDGYWVADPDNPETENDGSGGVNSVLVLK